MREGRYSEAQAARLVREVLRCVAQAHAKHIMIRDVKPQNVGGAVACRPCCWRALR